MVLSATQAIPVDAPLLLSYFEGGNDEFLLHYGAYHNVPMLHPLIVCCGGWRCIGGPAARLAAAAASTAVCQCLV
jgi:hypothetical protein